MSSSKVTILALCSARTREGDAVCLPRGPPVVLFAVLLGLVPSLTAALFDGLLGRKPARSAASLAVNTCRKLVRTRLPVLEFLRFSVLRFSDPERDFAIRDNFTRPVGLDLPPPAFLPE